MLGEMAPEDGGASSTMNANRAWPGKNRLKLESGHRLAYMLAQTCKPQGGEDF